MKKFLMFDVLIAPWMIRILYWILQLAIIVVSLTGGRIFNFQLGNGEILLIFVIGSLLLRLVAETLIVWFKIAENTQQMKKEEN